MTNQKVNINVIAHKTGLSITTVSRVLNGKGEQYRISKKSQEKVREAARELNYVPNQYAASLKSGKSKTIALIIPSLNNPFFADIASEINAEIRKQGYIALIGDSDENVEIEKQELMLFESRNIEGLVIAPCGHEGDYIKKLHEQGLPVVCIDRYFEDLDLPYVSTDNYKGAYAATNYLIENGHTNINCIQGVQQSTPNKLRVKGFVDAMSESGINNSVIVGDEFSVQNGYLETKLLLQQKVKPTAIFTLSNTIAMGCIKALKEENIPVPDDISIITFDDHPYLDYLATPLTCVTQPTDNICKIAIKYLFSMINKEGIETKQVLLNPELIHRKSVKRIN